MSEAISPTGFSILPYIRESWRVLERNPTKADVIIKKKISAISLLLSKQDSAERAENRIQSIIKC